MTIKKAWFRLPLAGLIALGCLNPLTPPPAIHAAGVIIRVTPAGAASGACGDTWATACDLQYALTSVATAGDELWVGRGLYTPGTALTTTFTLTDGVALYGGFAMAETSQAERNWAANVTVLSGDIDANDIVDANGVVTNTANIRGNNAYHVVVGSGVTNTAVLDGFTITGGDAGEASGYHGGGMFNNHGSPTVANVTFSGNIANHIDAGGGAGVGGGMYNLDNSNPALINVVFDGNSVRWNGGGMANNNSSPTLTNVTFSRNSAVNGWGGMYNYASSPTLTNVTFSDNSAGGMYNVANSRPTLIHVTFSDNSISGMRNEYSNPTLTNVTFSDNSAGEGGGMRNEQSSPILTNVTFSNNFAAIGGGMYNLDNSNPLLTNVTFSDNSATYGGGISNLRSSPVLTNVTFSDNSAPGGVTVGGGGGMYNHESNPTLTNVTFSGNTAVPGGGGMLTEESSPLVRNTLFVRGAAGDNCAGDAFAANSTANLADDASCGNSAPQSTHINLGLLGNYGGSTQTIPILYGSAAIDAGNPVYCPATDQRGYERVGQCDIGAFEAPRWIVLFLPSVVR